jgi:hypothetical protein
MNSNNERMNLETADFGGNMGLLSEDRSFQEEDVKDASEGPEDEELMDVDEDPTQSDQGSSHVPSDDDEDDDEDEDDEDSEFQAEQNSRETSVVDISAVSETGASSATGWSSTALLSSSTFKPVTEWIPFTAIQIDRKLPKKLKKHEYEPLPNGFLVNLSQPCLNVQNYTGQETPKKERIWTFSGETPTITTRPGLSDWLDLSTIHPLEAEAFPLFCGPEASPINKEVYSTIRNAMIYAYASHPALYLSITECYKHLRYEMQDLVVVHRFLERYKLINYEVLGRYVKVTCAVISHMVQIPVPYRSRTKGSRLTRFWCI